MSRQISAQIIRLTHSRWLSNQSGTVAVSFALLATAFLGVAALALDMARGQNLAARISNALDASAMAGAKALDRGDTDTEVQTAAVAFFDAQMSNVRLHKVTMGALTVTIDKEKGSVSTAIDANLGTTFGAVLGTNKIQIAKSSNVTYKARDVELAMALDVTGSMNEGTRLADMRSAAKDVLDTLFAEAKTDKSVRVAIVPWAAAVNAGTLAASVSGGTSSDGCVVERQNGQSDDSYPSGSASLRSLTSPYGYYSCPTDPVMPLRGKSKNSEIRAMLDSFAPVGGTAGHLGMSWAWYLLSPSWAGLMPTGSEPSHYAPNQTVKAVLLLSDGEFNLSYLSGASDDVLAMSNESYDQFHRICTGMKQNRIAVYTVGFGVPDTRAESELRDCASSEKNYFQAVSGADLKQVFKSIALQLKQLRLTK